MNNIASLRLSVIIIGVCSFLPSTAAQADGILPQSLNTTWHAVVGVGGGVAVTTNLARNQNFPIINPITDEFYNYTQDNSHPAAGLFEAFLGAERFVYKNWMMQAGIAYAQAGSYTITGTFVQGADVPSSDQFTYKYSVMTHQLLAQAKLMRAYHERWFPYVLAGVGPSFNSTRHYATTVPALFTYTRQYADKTSTSFAFRVGAGVDYSITSHARIGIAYRFSDLGGITLGSASINSIAVAGTLSQSSLYGNEVLAQFTYVM
jgi:opacity protein-like surface antigen